MPLNNKTFETVISTDTFKQWADKCNELIGEINITEIPTIDSVVGISNNQTITGNKTFDGPSSFASASFAGLLNSVSIASGNLVIGQLDQPEVTYTKFYDPNITFQKSILDPVVSLTLKSASPSTLLITDGNLEIGGSGDLVVGGQLEANGFSVDGGGNLSVDGGLSWGPLDSYLQDGLGLKVSGGDIETTAGGLIVTDEIVWGGGTLFQNGNATLNNNLFIEGDEIEFSDSTAPILSFPGIGYDWEIPTSKPLEDSILSWDIGGDTLEWVTKTDFADDIELAVSSSLTAANFSIPVQLLPVGTIIAVDSDVLTNWDQADEGNGLAYVEDAEFSTWLVPDGVKQVSFDSNDTTYEKIAKLINPALVGQTSGTVTLTDLFETAPTGQRYIMKVAEDAVINFRLRNKNDLSGGTGIKLFDAAGVQQSYLDINGGSIAVNYNSKTIDLTNSGRQLNVRSTFDPYFADTQNGFVAGYTTSGQLRTKWPVANEDAVSKSYLENQLDVVNTTVDTLETTVNTSLSNTLASVEAENQILLDRINVFENVGRIWKLPAREGNLTIFENANTSSGNQNSKDEVYLTGSTGNKLWGTSMSNLNQNWMYITSDDKMATVHSDDYDYGTQKYTDGAPIAALSPITGTWAKAKEIVPNGHRTMMIDEDGIPYAWGYQSNYYGLRGQGAYINPENNWTSNSASGLTVDQITDHTPIPCMVPNATAIFSSNKCNYIRIKQVAYDTYLSGDYWWRRNGFHVITKDGYDLDDAKFFTGNNEDDGINKPTIRGRVISGGHLNANYWYENASANSANATTARGPIIWGPGQTQMGAVLWWEYGNSTQTLTGSPNGEPERVQSPGNKSFNFYTPENANYDSDYPWYIKKIVSSCWDHFVIVGKEGDDDANELWHWGINAYYESGNQATRGVNNQFMVPVHDGINRNLGSPMVNDGGNTRIFRRKDSQPHGLKNLDAIKLPNNYWYFVVLGDGNNERKNTRFRVYPYSGTNALKNGLFPNSPGTTNATSYTLSATTSTFIPNYQTRLTGIVDLQINHWQNNTTQNVVWALRKNSSTFSTWTNPNHDLWTWGRNNHGQTGQGNTGSWRSPAKITGYTDQIYNTGHGNFVRKNAALFFTGYHGNSGGVGFAKAISSTNTTQSVTSLQRVTIGAAGNNACKKLFVVPWQGNTGNQQFAVTRSVTDEAGGIQAQLYVNGYTYYHETGWHMGSGAETHDSANNYTNGWRRIFFPEDPMNIVQIATGNPHVMFILCKDGGDPDAERGRLYVAGWVQGTRATSHDEAIHPVFTSAQRYVRTTYV